jgi:hypothetical protein
MEINQSLKSNLIADVENILSIKISDENTDLLSRCFEITIGHAIPKLSISEREAKLQERLDLQIYANDNLLAQNRGLMELNEARKRYSTVYETMIDEIMPPSRFIKLQDELVELRQRIAEIEKELGLNKE